jgi:hypothetical protein
MNKYLLLIILLITNKELFAHGQIYNVVTPVSYFVDHIKQLNTLKSYLSKYKTVSVVGTSGIGKTQLIRTYVYDNKNQYKLIWFFDCNLDLNKEFLKLAKQLNKYYDAGISEEAELSKKEVMQFLVKRSDWLLVFDNLMINKNDKVQDIINWEHNGNVIIASQDNESLPYTVIINSFDKKDVVTLAENLLDNGSLEDVEFLYSAFKGYPILIVQGAQLLNRVKGLSRDEYKKKVYQSVDKIKLNIELAIKELPTSAVNLLSKIALINNQAFSKNLLKIITDYPDNLENDIFQLSKLMLISNVEANEQNPIFEMHDIISQKVLEIDKDKNNKKHLEDILTKLIDFMPNNILEGHRFRQEVSISENLEIILKNAQAYHADIYKIMILNAVLLTDYINNFDYYSAEESINWFNDCDNKRKFNYFLMSNEEKRAYGQYLTNIGGYHKRRFVDDNTALKYYLKAKKVFDDVKGHESIKCNLYYNLAFANISLGYIDQGKNYIKMVEQLFDHGLVDSSDRVLLHLAKVRLFFIQGEYFNALKEANITIEAFTKNGIDSNDLLLTNIYLLKAEVLNVIKKYEAAYVQTQQLYKMYKPVKKEDHEVFGRIYTQMARSELGLGRQNKALAHIKKAIAIFLSDDRRNPKKADYPEDPDLAASYVVQGDIFFVQDNLKQAIESYKKAQIIYFYLYRNRSKNIAHISHLYTQGGKAACKANDLYNYKIFSETQVKEFGVNHPNTVTMFEYCNQHEMDL